VKITKRVLRIIYKGGAGNRLDKIIKKAKEKII